MITQLSVYLKLVPSILLPALLTVIAYYLKRLTYFGRLPKLAQQIIIGILFGGAAVFATEFGVTLNGATINVRTAAPLCAGLLFGGPAGITAGIIGGVERWFAVAWGAGEYSRLACSISTVLSGVFAAYLRRSVFDNKRPTLSVSFVTAGVMVVVDMILIFIMHISEPVQAFEVVRMCTVPMVFTSSISVFLANLAIALCSSSLHKSEKRYPPVSQLIQNPILISVILAYLASTTFVFQLQTYAAEENATELMELGILDVQEDLFERCDRYALEVAHVMANEVSANPGVDLVLLADKYDVSAIWIVDENGIVVSASDGRVGYDMASDSDLSEDKQQSSKFLVLLDGVTKEYVQEYRELTADSNVSYKLAGVALDDGGFVQIGYRGDDYIKVISSQIENISGNRRVGENGYIFVADSSGNIINKNSDISETTILQLGISNPDELYTDELNDITVNGEDCYCTFAKVEGIYIFSVMPVSEVYSDRVSMFYINSFMEVLVYTMLFIHISIIIRRVIVNNLHKVNARLSRIIGGNLNTTVDVRSSDEFASLSDDINTTVGTLKHYIDEAENRIDQELKFAKDIQHSALPSVFPPYPTHKEFEIFATMDTARQVGGDFYDFYLIGKNKLVILIADVSGKGIPAAMFMMNAKATIKSLAETRIPVNEVFTRANEKLCDGNDAGMFVTAWMAVIDLATGHAEFANAGHNPPLIYRKDKGFEYLRSRAGLVLAGMEGIKYKLQTFDLAPGDRIYLYTDGVTEAINKAHELYSEERLRDFLNSHSSLSATEMLPKVKKDIDRFAGEEEQFDDITMLMFDYHGDPLALNYKEYTADDSSLEEARGFIEESLLSSGANSKVLMQVSVAFEEMYVNVCHYAYAGSDSSDKTVKVGYGVQDGDAVIVLRDRGVPFNPFVRDDPDITLSAEERGIGGLGIFMTKKFMDKLDYEYSNGYNIVTMRKKIAN